MAVHTKIAVDTRIDLVGNVGVVRAGVGRASGAICVSHSVASGVHTSSRVSSVTVDSTAICRGQHTSSEAWTVEGRCILTQVAVDARIYLVCNVGVVRAGVGRASGAVGVSHSVASGVHTSSRVSSVSVDSTAICRGQYTIWGHKRSPGFILTKAAVNTGIHLVCHIGVVRTGVSRASTILVLCVGVSGVHACVHSSSAGSTSGAIGLLSTSI